MRYWVFVAGLVVLTMALCCQAGDLPTPEEVAAIVREGGFGPAIGVTNNLTVSDETFIAADSYIEEIELSDDGKYLYVIHRAPSNMWLSTYPMRKAPDSVFRIVYGVEDGKIVYLGRQDAKVVQEPAIEIIEFEPYCHDGSCKED
jgi:hypothetical protein